MTWVRTPPRAASATPPPPQLPPRKSVRIAANPVPPGHWRGSSPLACPHSQITKLANARTAATRNRLFNSQHPSSLNNLPTSLIPTPIAAQRTEMSIARASRTLPASDIAAAINKETHKQLTKYASLRRLQSQDHLEARRAFLRSSMFIKQKASGLVTARLAIDGSHQPPDSYTNTFAGTSDVTNRSFIIAVTLADAAHRDILPELVIGSCYIRAAFLQSSLPRSSPSYPKIFRIQLSPAKQPK
jgi:hypothetical protein